jgi:outer membrane protein
MKKQLFLFLTVLFFTGAASAQTSAPTPTPAPKAADAQNVRPENLEGVPAIAPKYQNDDLSLPNLGRVGVELLEQKPVSLNDVIKAALENNKDIEVSRQNLRSAEFELQAADGIFTPRVSGTAYFERSKLPSVSIFNPTQSSTVNNSLVGNVTYQGFIKKYGATYNASLGNQRTTTDNTFSPLNPQYNTTFNFTFNQPLLRGRNIDSQRRVIEIAKRNISLTDGQFRQRTIETVAVVQRAYWDLTFALRNLQVQRDGVRDANVQLVHNRRLVDEGQLAPVDIVASETQVANLELAVYDALEIVNRAENLLKNLIATDKNDSLWRVSLVPTDNIDLATPRVTLPEALDLAMRNRPELELNAVAKEINEVDQKLYRDQARPQLDFFASYTSSGVRGAQNPDLSDRFGPVVIDPRLLGGYSSSLGDIFAQKYPTFRVGVTFNFPIRNSTSEAQLGKALVEKEKLETQREQIEQQIQVEVRNALQSLRTAEARLRTAAVVRENTFRQYESEQRKLDAGQSDVYKVLERQTALVNARSAEVRAQTELNKAIAEVERATGNSLKANNIEEKPRK